MRSCCRFRFPSRRWMPSRPPSLLSSATSHQKRGRHARTCGSASRPASKGRLAAPRRYARRHPRQRRWRPRPQSSLKTPLPRWTRTGAVLQPPWPARELSWSATAARQQRQAQAAKCSSSMGRTICQAPCSPSCTAAAAADLRHCTCRPSAVAAGLMLVVTTSAWAAGWARACLAGHSRRRAESKGHAGMASASATPIPAQLSCLLWR